MFLIFVVYKHVQPSHDPCLGLLTNNLFFLFKKNVGSLLSSAHGSITPRSLIQISSTLQTGDTHLAVYDFKNMRMFVSNASPVANNGTVVPAYDRPFVQLDMKTLFALTQ
jgi:hypothetical protein